MSQTIPETCLKLWRDGHKQLAVNYLALRKEITKEEAQKLLEEHKD